MMKIVCELQLLFGAVDKQRDEAAPAGAAIRLLRHRIMHLVMKGL
jgi:hypothetical protein